MSLRTYVRQLTTGTETRIPSPGNLVFMRASTAELLVTARASREGSGGRELTQSTPLSARQKIDIGPDIFDDVVIRNESGSTVDFTVLIGFGDYEAPLAEVGLEGPNTMSDVADNALSTTPEIILAADTGRKRAHIKSLAANTVNIRVGGSTVTTTRGLQLQPGEGVTIEGTAEIWAIAESGTPSVTITTERRV